MRSIIVPKGRTTVIQVSLGYDVSLDTIESQIREKVNQDSDLIAEWDVAFETDGTDGMLVFTLLGAETELITQSKGYMDIKRVSATEAFSVFDGSIKVEFPEVVTE